ncbi:MaoC family dehydratase [Pseudomaricurvus alkylphenolicus]|jgi:acyl dehydratase|uniref:MaoC family dehydratase n=1 Tax=Pseudomaricurvus alkylphenolicus TaxID=1306991 RepID=UPI0014230B32|nr:MaoC family dehydratase [Pseudomaricurvus alkylphenolicus]NIB41715.1 MaoC family dehydratase [Pseudomaricurvus alkylphenolicus]
MTLSIKKEEIENYIGYEAEPTPWHTVTQDQIDQFAECTLDRQYIHVDPEKAKGSPFGSTIAHGFLTLSMLSHFAASYSILIEDMVMAVNSGFDKIRFLAPVKVDSRIRGRAKFVDIQENAPGQFRIKTEVSVEIEGEDKPALIAEWITVQIIS